MSNSIPLVNVNRLHQKLRPEIDAAIGRVIDAGDFILGADVEAFEREFAAYIGVKHCIGFASGLDAIVFALKGLGVGPGDEVITAGNTFIATALAIQHVGAAPVLVDHDPDTFNVDPTRVASAITPWTRAIVPVHLYGRAAEMHEIHAIAREHNLFVVEDAAQAHGAKYRGKRCGSLSDAAAFSFYPGKNLGAMGDGGAMCTDNDRLAEWARTARNYGSNRKYHHLLRGGNSRLDTLQAAILRIKLRQLDEGNARRRTLARRYVDGLQECGVTLPVWKNDEEHVHHLFVIRVPRRDELLEHLQACGIGAGIHYPIPIHKQPAFVNQCIVPRTMPHTETFCSQLLSLPLCPELTFDEQDRVIGAIQTFISERGAPLQREASTERLRHTESFATAPRR